jgi:DNA polymerase elongation subunit (family B)
MNYETIVVPVSGGKDSQLCLALALETFPKVLESSYVLCWAAKWYDKKEVMFDSVFNTKQPKVMLQRIHDLISEADAVCHYNGTRFDIPVLNKEFLLHHLAPPSPYKQIDLLKVVRKEFRFASNKLDHIAQRLGLGQKTAHEGYQLWVKCMNKDPVAWKVMEKYNKQDVLLLEKVYDRLLPWIKSHPNHNLFSGRGCPNCGSHRLQKRGFTYTTTGTFQRFQCTDCGSWSKSTKAIKEHANVSAA